VTNARVCLDAGADDLVPKPFAFAELAARIRAVLRRGTQASRAQCGEDLVMDRSPQCASLRHAIGFEPKEFGCWNSLMRNAGHPVSVRRLWNKSGG